MSLPFIHGNPPEPYYTGLIAEKYRLIKRWWWPDPPGPFQQLTETLQNAVILASVGLDAAKQKTLATQVTNRQLAERMVSNANDDIDICGTPWPHHFGPPRPHYAIAATILHELANSVEDSTLKENIRDSAAKFEAFQAAAVAV